MAFFSRILRSSRQRPQPEQPVQESSDTQESSEASFYENISTLRDFNEILYDNVVTQELTEVAVEEDPDSSVKLPTITLNYEDEIYHVSAENTTSFWRNRTRNNSNRYSSIETVGLGPNCVCAVSRDIANDGFPIAINIGCISLTR